MLYPCHRYAGMVNYRVGDVFHGPDKQLVYAFYRKIAERATQDCQMCWLRDQCAGGCP
ncbi:MAG: SPASM domain-containing protein [Planctomycetaceae bacterium]|nr:SPASM domain-containing protein [Planctomycetaceae bacterium]